MCRGILAQALASHYTVFAVIRLALELNFLDDMLR